MDEETEALMSLEFEISDMTPEDPLSLLNRSPKQLVDREMFIVQ